MDEIDIPPFFLCPISLEIMKDPVIVSTGITYDRVSIEKWLMKNNTCPITKQRLEIILYDSNNNSNIVTAVEIDNLTPNHTLRRLIQAWCIMNASHGIERIPTPKPPVSIAQVSKLIKEASESPKLLVGCLARIRSIASESEANRRCIESAGAVEFLVSIVINNTITIISSSSHSSSSSLLLESEANPAYEALCILHTLNLSESSLKRLITFKNGQFIDSLTRVLQRGFYESRAYSVFLLKSISEFADPIQNANMKKELFIELVQLLKDQISTKSSKSTLQTLIQLCSWGRNRVKAVESGAIPVLIDLLLDSKERKPCEMILILLEILSQCADGRAEIVSHGAGLAIVSKKILRVSKMANDRAVKILLSIARYSATPNVVQEMMNLGIVAKLCLVLQVDSGNKAKEKAMEILKLHGNHWRNSPCLPNSFRSSYPTKKKVTLCTRLSVYHMEND